MVALRIDIHIANKIDRLWCGRVPVRWWRKLYINTVCLQPSKWLQWLQWRSYL